MYKNNTKTLILVLLLGILLSFSRPQQACAEVNWTKHPNNPVLNLGNDWDRDHLMSPMVIFDGGVYKMWYSAWGGSYWQIGYATSLDGVNWEKYESNPVLSRGSVDSKDVHDPTIIYDGVKYEMWYTSSRFAATADFKIHHAVSNDGITWEFSPTEPVLVPTAEWEAQGVSAPHVIKKSDNLYMMWYSARNISGTWQIGLATSRDGIDWEKHSDNPFLAKDGPFVMYENGQYIMWYHSSPHSIEFVTSSDGVDWNYPLEGNPVITRGGSGEFDSEFVTSPTIAKVGDTYKMWYAGRGTLQGKRAWRIGHASTNELEGPGERLPIVLLPGMLGSWSAEGILEKKDVPYDAWKMTPFVHEYDGLIQTLKNAGYQDSGDNQDLFVFNYDWRRNLDSSADTLKQFLEEKVFPKTGDKKVNLVGHSLGGLVARSYLQKYETNGKIEKLITVGSPHKGALPAYKAWEGGEIETQDSLTWLAQKFILQIYKSGLVTNREALQDNAPVIKDLLPTFNFLKTEHPETGEIIEIPLEMMTVKNDYLSDLNSSISDFFETFQAILGVVEEVGVPEWYKVEGPSILDEILGNWVDGRPVGTEYGSGDKVVLEKSAKYEPDPAEVLSLEHGELIYKKIGLISLLSLIGVEVEEEQIVEGQATKVTPSLIIALLSPARFRAVCTQGTFESGEDKILLLPEVNLHDCQIEVIGEGEGEYKLIIGQIGPMGQISEEKWLKVEEETDEGEIDVYDFRQESQLVPLEQAKRLIDKLLTKEPTNRYLQRTKFYLQLEGDHKGRNYISAIENLLIFRRQITDSEMLTLSKEAIEKLVRVVKELGVVRDRREGKIAEIVLSGRLQRITEDLNRNKALSLDWGRNLLEEVREKQEFILGLVVKQLSN